jgi:hypothetical protein
MMEELIRKDLPPTISIRSRIFAPGISEVFIIKTIPKKHPEEVKARSD